MHPSHHPLLRYGKKYAQGGSVSVKARGLKLEHKAYARNLARPGKAQFRRTRARIERIRAAVANILRSH